jgi:uncharacterized protein (DUF697 family)
MLEKVKQLFSSKYRNQQLHAQLDKLRQRMPVPVFWLFGKTQSGKTTLIKYLTGAEQAEIGQGFQPCTRYSRLYEFPTSEAPLLKFLDTRGVDEPNYDPTEDLAQYGAQAHVVIVTVKVLDHAQENVIRQLRAIRQAQPSRPVVLVLTCLHEAYPQQQHPQPYPFTSSDFLGTNPIPDRTAAPSEPANDHAPVHAAMLEPLLRSLNEQRERFHGLVDRVVPIDLTQAEEGFAEPNYGGEALKQVLLDVLPHAYRHTLLMLEDATRELQDLYARQALPRIIAYSSLAASAGAVPIPWLDLLILPGIQTQMIYHLARFYGQPLSGTRFMELASTMGLGIMTRQATRELMKFIPYVGSVAGAALAGASTFALGKSFCFYYRAIHKGHVPRAEELRRYYHEQLAVASEKMKEQR